MRTGRMLSQISDESKAVELAHKIMSPFTDEELEELAPSPEFIMACISLLTQSVLRFPGDSVRRQREAGK